MVCNGEKKAESAAAADVAAACWSDESVEEVSIEKAREANRKENLSISIFLLLSASLSCVDSIGS